MDLIDYLKSLYLTDYIILIETADTDIWEDSGYTELFSHWGLTEEQFTPETDCILLSGSDNTGYAFRNFRVSGSQEDTPLGVFRYFEDGAGSYGIYCNGEQYYLSQLGDFGIEITNCRKPLTDI